MENIKKLNNQDFDKILLALNNSKFRSSFTLKKRDKEYVKNKGMDTIKTHAYDFINKRLAPAIILNDGKQTPMKGHPVFISQHATATCCRSCLEKWHRIPKGRALTKEEVDYILNLIMKYIENQCY